MPRCSFTISARAFWLDNIARGLLTSGTLGRYIRELAVTGLTSNPTIFDRAVQGSDSYDDAIRTKTLEGKSGEALFFELALEDLVQAADLFRPIHEATGGVDGWVSIEVSPPASGRHGRHHEGGGAIACARATPQPVRQDSRYCRGHYFAAAGVRPQRLLWASTGTKNPAAPDILYIEALAAPDTINTMRKGHCSRSPIMAA